ncbi:MAG: phage baseplate protein, partial [Enterococcus lemanii]
IKVGLDESSLMSVCLEGHQHTTNDITDLQTTLNNKADISHTHTSFNNINVDTINGITIAPSTQNPTHLVGRPVIPVIKADSVMEVGKYIDFHNTGKEDDDYTIRLRAENDKLVCEQNFEAPNLTKSALVNMFYPVGSIYTSMNSTNPATLFGGTWQQIIDRFLYCTDNSNNTGGSRKISVNQLPSHEHDFRDYTFTWHWGETYASTYHVYADAICRGGASNNNYLHTQPHVHNGTAAAGSGEDYMPEYITVYAWWRVA